MYTYIYENIKSLLMVLYIMIVGTDKIHVIYNNHPIKIFGSIEYYAVITIFTLLQTAKAGFKHYTYKYRVFKLLV